MTKPKGISFSLSKIFINSSLGALILSMSMLSLASEPVPALDAMDVFELEWASDPQVAPDGKSVVYVRRSFDVMSDAAKATLWQVSIDGSDHRPLNSNLHRSTSPRWSPEGDKVAYVSSESGSSRFISSGWIPARCRSRHTSSKARQTSPGPPMVNGWPSPCRLKNRRHPLPSVARHPKVLSGRNRRLLSRPRATNTMAEALSIQLTVMCSSYLPTEV